MALHCVLPNPDHLESTSCGCARLKIPPKRAKSPVNLVNMGQQVGGLSADHRGADGGSAGAGRTGPERAGRAGGPRRLPSRCSKTWWRGACGRTVGVCSSSPAPRRCGRPSGARHHIEFVARSTASSWNDLSCRLEFNGISLTVLFLSGSALSGRSPALDRDLEPLSLAFLWQRCRSPRPASHRSSS